MEERKSAPSFKATKMPEEAKQISHFASMSGNTSPSRFVSTLNCSASQWSAVSDVFTEFMCSDLMLEDLYHTVMLILYTVLISSFIREQQFYPKH